MIGGTDSRTGTSGRHSEESESAGGLRRERVCASIVTSIVCVSPSEVYGAVHRWILDYIDNIFDTDVYIVVFTVKKNHFVYHNQAVYLYEIMNAHSF